MLNQTMKQVAKKFQISEYTLRYYDNINLIPGVVRNKQGRREFTEEATGWLTFIMALRNTGMPLDEIRRYIQLTYDGPTTITERIEMLKKQSDDVDQQIEDLKHQKEIINYKIDNYKQSLESGNLTPNEKPYLGKWV